MRLAMPGDHQPGLQRTLRLSAPLLRGRGRDHQEEPGRPAATDVCHGRTPVSDEKWRKTESDVQLVIAQAFGGPPPQDFELHACELLAPEGEGPFTGWDHGRRNGSTSVQLGAHPLTGP